MSSGDILSEVLNDLGVCPLWGRNGSVKKTISLNPKMNPNKLKKNSFIQISSEMLQFPNQVLFLANKKITPRNRKSNLCDRKKKNITKNKTIKPLKKENTPKVFKFSDLKISDLEVLKDKNGSDLEAIQIISSKNLKKEKKLEIVLKFKKNIDVVGSPKLKLQAKGTLDLSTDFVVEKNKITYLIDYSYILNRIKEFRVSIVTNKNNYILLNSKKAEFNEESYVIISEFYDFSGPKVISISAKQKDYFKTGDEITFIVEFNEPILSERKPVLNVNLDSGKIKAKFSKFSKDYKKMYFKYLVLSKDLSPGGVEVVGKLDTFGGEIFDKFGNRFLNDSRNFYLKKTIVIRPKGYILKVTSPKKKIYNYKDEIIIGVDFDQEIKVKGKPYLDLKIGNKEVKAFLKSHKKNHLSFNYFVEQNDSENNGIIIFPNIKPNKAKMSNLLGENLNLKFDYVNAKGVKVDSGKVFVKRVTSEGKNNYKIGDTVKVSIEFNTNVLIPDDISIDLNVSGNQLRLNNPKKINEKTIEFSFNVSKEHEGRGLSIVSPLVVSNKTVTDVKGNIAELDFNTVNLNNVVFDTTRPKILKLETPTSASLEFDDDLQILVYFSEPVIVKGKPKVNLDIRSGNVQAMYREGSGTEVLVFQYKVKEVDRDNGAGEAVSPLILLKSSIKDLSGNPSFIGFRDTKINSEIDGTLKYGLISSKKKGSNIDDENINRQVIYSAGITASSTTLSALDLEDDSEAVLSSSLSPGVNVGALFILTPNYHLSTKLSYQQINFAEASTFSISNLSNNYFKLGLDNRILSNDEFRFILSLDLEQLPFVHAQGTNKLVIDPIVSIKPSVGFEYDFYSYAYLELGIAMSAHYLAARDTDNFSLDAGQETSGNIFIKYFTKKYEANLSIFNRRVEQNSDVFEHEFSSSGLNFTFSQKF